MVALAGITPDELTQYKAPATFQDQAGAVAQPVLGETEGPHLTNYPPGAYEAIMGIPDERIWQLVDHEPPVKTR